ncbi:flagellar biosynthesis protein FliQ [Thermohalobacter berrensis]|uniref:Flagellar biosynthetic protein FliQ n=1 Tax=Thermohalobacter berrensis TaxID=99594 RepID=A0A419TAD8_9FIRM|nr:flagellar biosynthesis protein FliQ [Thermohalobacter berrensis]RKD34449.1 EscS/YscS/HrcS family type III secretion system export apparatus protein [Thermohalobacter berrensis]
MTQGDIITLAQQAMMTVLILAAPMLGFGLLVGLLVSIFQATTQIQEATLAFIPKIVAVLLSFLIFSPWLINVITDFTRNLFTNINLYIK